MRSDIESTIRQLLFKENQKSIAREEIFLINSRSLVSLTRNIVFQAVISGLAIKQYSELGIIVPERGGVSFSEILTDCFKELNQRINFFPAKIFLSENGCNIEENCFSLYYGKSFIVFDDIVNTGETIRKINKFLNEKLSSQIVAVLCLIDKGGQSAETLDVLQYFPGTRIK